MSEANPTLDPIGYRCDGCGRLFRDPNADLSAIRAAGGRSCCPERKPIGLSDRIEELEAKLAKAVEALGELIDHTHNCEKELTEELHHADFCGESLPLTNARDTLAELTGGRDD